MNHDFRPIIESSYHLVIASALNKLKYFNFDMILRDVTGLYIDKDSIEIDHNDILLSDLFYVGRNIWKSTLELLYERYLPEEKYEFKWKIEVTPYTIMLCNLTEEIHDDREVSLLKKLLSIDSEYIENNYNKVIDDIGLCKLGLPNGIADVLPDNLLPKEKNKQLSLLFRLMNFPPLGELALFHYLYNASIINKAEKLSVAFDSFDREKMPSFNPPQSLFLSYFHIDHSIFQQLGLNGFEQIPSLHKYKSEFENIKKLSIIDSRERLQDKYICPCCGIEQDFELPIDFFQYKNLIKNQELSREIGLIYFEEFLSNFKSTLSSSFKTILPSINIVDNPKCLILVEGESEEVAIPLLALKMGVVLSQNNIQVYNSKSKEKLCSDFFSFKEKYPGRKMVCLLDSDAEKERINIERVIKGHKDKYHLVFIERGTFEDLFELNESIKVINELYPDGDSIMVSDFSSQHDFVQNIKKALHFKKKATFDKVLFAKMISFTTDKEHIPKKISETIDMAIKFARPKMFFRD